jgi:hypothetical protein
MRTSSHEAHNTNFAGLCAGKLRNVADILSKSSWEVAFENPSLDVDEPRNAEFPVNRLICIPLCLCAMGVRTTTSPDDRGEGFLLHGPSVLCLLFVSKLSKR